MSQTPKPEFKFGDAEGNTPSTIQKVAQLDAYLVSYRDGENKEHARVVFRLPGADATFMINEAINGKNIVTQSHPWFHRAFVDKLRTEGFEEHLSEAAASV